jgi:hypothetical protein
MLDYSKLNLKLVVHFKVHFDEHPCPSILSFVAFTFVHAYFHLFTFILLELHY